MCICVDDYGLSEGINTAALALAAMHRVHAIGCMVGGPAWAAWRHAVQRLTAAEVDVGLHLDLTDSPLLPATRAPLLRWIRRSYTRQLDRAAVRAEIRAQLDAFEDALGRPPAYVDGHQHVHQLPVVRDELVHAVQQRYGRHAAGLPWLRATRGLPGLAWQPSGGLAAWAKSRVITALGAGALAKQARRAGIGQNSMLMGVYGFDAGPERYLALVAAALHAGSDGALLMSHPSQVVDAEHGAARVVECTVLQGRALGEVLAAAGIELQPMSAILRQAAPGGGTHRRA